MPTVNLTDDILAHPERWIEVRDGVIQPPQPNLPHQQQRVRRAELSAPADNITTLNATMASQAPRQHRNYRIPERTWEDNRDIARGSPQSRTQVHVKPRDPILHLLRDQERPPKRYRFPSLPQEDAAMMKDATSLAPTPAVISPATSTPRPVSKSATSSPDPNTPYDQLHRHGKFLLEPLRVPLLLEKPQPAPPQPKSKHLIPPEDLTDDEYSLKHRARLNRRARVVKLFDTGMLAGKVPSLKKDDRSGASQSDSFGAELQQPPRPISKKDVKLCETAKEVRSRSERRDRGEIISAKELSAVAQAARERDYPKGWLFSQPMSESQTKVGENLGAKQMEAGRGQTRDWCNGWNGANPESRRGLDPATDYDSLELSTSGFARAKQDMGRGHKCGSYHGGLRGSDWEVPAAFLAFDAKKEVKPVVTTTTVDHDALDLRPKGKEVPDPRQPLTTMDTKTAAPRPLGNRAGRAEFSSRTDDLESVWQDIEYRKQDARRAELASRAGLVAKSTKERTPKVKVAKANDEHGLVLLPEEVAVLPATPSPFRLDAGANWDPVASNVEINPLFSLFHEEIAPFKAVYLARMSADPEQRHDNEPSAGERESSRVQDTKVEAGAGLQPRRRRRPPTAAEIEDGKATMRTPDWGWSVSETKELDELARAREVEELAGVTGKRSCGRRRGVCFTPVWGPGMEVEMEAMTQSVAVEGGGDVRADMDEGWVSIPTPTSTPAPTTASAEANASSDSDSDIDIDIDVGAKDTAENGKASRKGRDWCWWW